jgi:hypothetical protein
MKSNDSKQRLFEVMEMLNPDYKRPVDELAYKPSTNTRKIVPAEVSDEDLDRAEQILQTNTDPTWDVNKWGSMIIGVTGKYQVYYTLWKYSPKSMTSQISYMGNLATDIIRAAEKAKKVAGKQPVSFEQYETLKGLAGAPSDVIGFGKYRGRTLGEVYTEDPQYVIWISKNVTPKNAKQQEFQKIAQEFADTYFRSMGETNRAAETKDYFGNIGDTFDGDVMIVKVDKTTSEFGISFRFKAETNKSRFQFYIQPKTLAKFLGIKIEFSYARVAGRYGTNTIENISDKSMDELLNGANALINKTVPINGKIKDNKEIVGKKYSILTRVAFM